jgi:hypothetical protein
VNRRPQKGQSNDLQKKHKGKDRVTQTPLKPVVIPDALEVYSNLFTFSLVLKGQL